MAAGREIQSCLAVAKGMVRLVRRPRERAGYGGPFNGQLRRAECFRQLVKAIACDVIIETGTFRGTTSAFMRDETGLLVLTVERNPLAFGYCAARFLLRRGVKVFNADSRPFLATIDVSEGLHKRPFVYLDAHCHKVETPISDEVRLVTSRWPKAVIMIDDFEVPDDPGYFFDSYSNGEALCLDYLRRFLPAQAAVYFPTAVSGSETGRRRGAVVIAVSTDTQHQLDRVPSIRRWAG